MAVNVFKQTKNKLWSEKENWSLKKVPAATEEVEIEAGKECELITTAGKCLSFTMPSTAKFVGSAALEVGSTTEPKAGGVSKRAVSIASGAVVSWTGKLELVSTYKTGELGVLIVPELKGAFQIKELSATATYILEEALLSSSSVGLKNTTEGGLNTNSKKVTCSEFSAANKAAVSLGKSELLDLSSWTWNSGGTLTAGESLIRVEGGTFTGGAQTYNNVTLKGAGIEVKAVGTGEGADTFNVLKLETKGLAGTKVHEGVTLALTTLECNGTEAEPCIIESSVAEQKWKIKAATNQTVKYLKVKDSKAETSTFTTEGPSGKEAEYLVRSTNEESKWVFKAIAAGTAIAFSTKATFATATLAKVLQRQPVTAATKQTFATSKAASVKQVQPATATTKLVFKGTANPRQSQPVTATTKVPFVSTASVRQSQPVTATGKVRFKGAAELSQGQVLYVVAQGMTLFGSTVRIRQVQPVAASTKVRMAGSLTVEEEGVASASYLCMII